MTAANIVDISGGTGPVETVAMISSATATAYIEMVGSSGISLTAPTQITIPTTAGGTSLYAMLVTAGVVTSGKWNEDFVGIRVISVSSGDVYYNYGATMTRPRTGDGFGYTVASAKIPSSNGLVIPAGNYASAGGYVLGRVTAP